MQGQPFVAVALGRNATLFAQHTRGHPAAAIDAVTAVTERTSSGTILNTLVHIRGMPPEAFAALQAGLSGQFGEPEVLNAQPEERTWILRCRFPEDRLTPMGRLLNDLMQREAFPWIHAHRGQLSVRFEAGPDASADVDRVRGHLEQVGLEGDVGVAQVPFDEVAAYQLLKAMAARMTQGEAPTWRRVERARRLD